MDLIGRVCEHDVRLILKARCEGMGLLVME